MEQATYEDIKDAYNTLSHKGNTHYIFYRGITEIQKYLKGDDIEASSEFIDDCIDKIEEEN